VLVNITAGPSVGVREATQAVSVIQQEAGDEAEVIFGTVIDANMGDQIRVTCIATGFDAQAAAKPEPAFARRTPIPPVKRSTPPAQEPPRPANIRRLSASELHARRQERIREDDTDIPPFLRRMMD